MVPIGMLKNKDMFERKKRRLNNTLGCPGSGKIKKSILERNFNWETVPNHLFQKSLMHVGKQRLQIHVGILTKR